MKLIENGVEKLKQLQYLKDYVQRKMYDVLCTSLNSVDRLIRFDFLQT